MAKTIVEITGEPFTFLKGSQFRVTLARKLQFLLDGFQFADEFGTFAAGTDNAIDKEIENNANQPLQSEAHHSTDGNLADVPIRNNQNNQCRDDDRAWNCGPRWQDAKHLSKVCEAQPPDIWIQQASH